MNKKFSLYLMLFIIFSVFLIKPATVSARYQYDWGYMWWMSNNPNTYDNGNYSWNSRPKYPDNRYDHWSGVIPWGNWQAYDIKWSANVGDFNTNPKYSDERSNQRPWLEYYADPAPSGAYYVSPNEPQYDPLNTQWRGADGRWLSSDGIWNKYRKVAIVYYRLWIPDPIPSNVTITTYGGTTGFTNTGGENKIKSGYGFGLGNNNYTSLSSNPSIGGWISNGWFSKSQLVYIRVNSISGFNLNSSTPLITGLVNGQPPTTSSSLSPTTSSNAAFWWNWYGSNTFYSSPATLFNFNLYPNSHNTYSVMKNKFLYVPQTTADGNYNISIGNGATANVTLHWDNWVLEPFNTKFGTIWIWVYAGSSNQSQNPNITPYTYDFRVSGSMFDDDSNVTK